MNITPETQARAQAVLDYIHEHPEQHNQDAFFEETKCGTTMCIAGTTLFLEHGIKDQMEFWSRDLGGSFSDIAGELLGLDQYEANDLFYQMNNEAAVQMLKCLIVGDELGFQNYAEYTEEEDDE